MMRLINNYGLSNTLNGWFKWRNRGKYYIFRVIKELIKPQSSLVEGIHDVMTHRDKMGVSRLE